jgi:hypothetical protein
VREKYHRRYPTGDDLNTGPSEGLRKLDQRSAIEGRESDLDACVWILQRDEEKHDEGFRMAVTYSVRHGDDRCVDNTDSKACV